MNIDLTKYVVARWGGWFLEKESFTPNELRLGGLRDGVTLAGPLCIRVSIRARNHFTLYGTSAVALQERDVFSYKLDIPPGQTWTYPAPRALVVDTGAVAAPPTTMAPSAAAFAAHSAAGPDVALNPNILEVNPAALYERDTLWGANAGFGVAIRPCGPEQCADPCAPDPCRPVDPCAPKTKACGCSSGGGCGGGCGCSGGGDCGCKGHPDDVPCNFATGRGAPTGMFFPAACEPCAPGAFVGMPPTKGPSLLVAAARGGTVRTRYFNGMFITKEDLWTDQNNNRLKHTLMNRAMGQGVVWGFDVGFDGETVCVLPGYGVDCCGNDIVISSPYRVDAQMLLRDPAAAALLATGRAARMNLLLEYFECPEEPRPVHGDPCAPEASRCEMSRIRETARLRLVPPIDVDDSGCIKDFLDEMKRLKGDPVVGPLLTPTPSPAPAPTPVPAPPPPTTVETDLTPDTSPFKFVYTNTSASPPTVVEAPPVMFKRVGIPFKGQDILNIALQLIPAVDPSATFSSITVKQTAPIAQPIPVALPSPEWKTTVPATATGGRVAFSVEWTLQSNADTSYKGITTVTLTRANDLQVITIDTEGGGKVTRIITQPPPPPPPVRIPCLTEACDPEGRPRFPIQVPWLHEDPGHPEQAADPKVIVLAILYAVFVSQMEQLGPTTSQPVAAEQERLANALNLTAWRLFYDKPPTDQRLSLIDALKRLFQCWCKSLLYKGPRCEPGCGTHGVVIGCAMVQGGSLVMVDPWGERRWVMHYPLLAHWGQQFGITPPDALASKFFDLICCVAQSYPGRAGTTPVPVPGAAPAVAAPAAGNASVVPLGASTLVFDQPANVPAYMAHAGVTPERTIALNPIEFVSRVVEALVPRAGAAPTTGGGFVHFTVNGIPELNFVTPAAATTGVPTSAAAPPAQPSPSAPAATGGGGHLAELVRSAFASRARAAAVPALLRSFAETLTHALLAALPIDVSTDAERTLRETMAAANIRSLAALLDQDPDHLHIDVLARANASGLAAILAKNEDQASSVATLVGDTLHDLGSEGRLVSRDDLRKPTALKAFKKAITEGLHGLLSAKAVGAEVDRALDNGG